MIIKVKKLIIYFICVAMGIILTISVTPVWNFVEELAFGFEIKSVESFPYEHMARIRTRPGGGDQTLFFEIDGKDAWRSPDMMPRDLNEIFCGIKQEK